jgi:hypothetical protein
MEKKFGRVNVTIKGSTPLLMNRLNPESLKAKSRQKLREYDQEKEAEASAYIATINGKKQLYVPGYAVYSMLIRAAGQYKSRRTSLSGILAGTIRVEPEFIPLGHCNYEVDVRPVVIQRMRVIKARAKIPEWEISFQIVYNKRILTDEIVKTLETILDDAGTRMGLLDYRPQHKGWFGTFEVTKFEIVD